MQVTRKDVGYTVELGRDDHRAQDTFREISLDLGFRWKRLKGFNFAKPFFESAISHNPRRIKEKRLAEVAYFEIANGLLQDGNIDEAKKYYALGRKFQTGGKYVEKFKALGIEFSKERIKGKLYHIVPKRGYGFLEPEGETGQSVYLHISEIMPNISIEEFENLEGRTFSFLLDKETGKGLHPAAKRARLLDLKEIQE